MVVYDLGLNDIELKYIKSGPDSGLFIYKKFDFEKLESYENINDKRDLICHT